MPYIKPSVRDSVTRNRPRNVGELNYAITMLCHEFIEREGTNYANFNAVVGVLESAKLELYRRRVAPYEDVKIQENGDL